MNTKNQELVNEIANSVIKLMETEGDNWFKPFNRIANQNGLYPQNIRGTHYSGMNLIILCLMQSQYKSNVWLTLRQCNKLKGKILKGSKGVKVRYVDFAENKETEETYGYMKWYTVFNLQQTTLYKEEVQEDLPYLPEVERNKNVDLFVASTKADIRYEVEGKCFYVPSQDFINMSPLNTWNDLEDETKETAYYATLLHELTHWTGNKTRLARDFDYATEELIAELGSAILCGMLGVTKKPMKNHAKYLNVWINSLKDNPKVIFKASAQAQKAYKYLVDLQPKQEQLKEVA